MENLKKQIEKKKDKGIVFIADNWGKFKGGIDVFNQKLCEAMGYVVNKTEVKVVCLVMGTIEDQAIQRAEEKNVTVIRYLKEYNQSFRDICKKALDKVEKLVPNTEFVWVGHDIITGKYASFISKKIREEKCAIIFHTDYYTIHVHRDDIHQRTENGIDYDAKNSEQIELANQVDWIFCVGPKVKERFKEFNKQDVYMIIPGLEEKIENKQNYGNIMVAGRFSGNSGGQKNWEGVCKAITQALNTLYGQDIDTAEQLTVIYGFAPEMQATELKELEQEVVKANTGAGGVIPTIRLKKFDESRTGYLNELAKCGLFIMGSEIESFGMVAWEALAQEVPIIISKSSGVYEYLESELGYLLKGLCGTFPARRGDETIECMGRSIASILSSSDKMKKSTILLRNEMSKHKWEIVAIEMAKTLGIDSVMDEMIFKDNNCFEFVYSKRKLLMDELKHQIKNKKVKEYAIFFGGISRKLFWIDDELNMLDKVFIYSIVNLLNSEEGKHLHIYFCYETKGAIAQRVSELDEIMEKKEKILYDKAEKIGELKNIISDMMGEVFESCKERFHLVPLTKSPSVYINIMDNNCYFTVKYENRSSDNATMKLSDGLEGKSEKLRLLDHMNFILSDNKVNDECNFLINDIERRISSYERKSTVIRRV